MKRLILAVLLVFVGCVGGTPYNPVAEKFQRDCVDGMMFERKIEKRWWQLDTSQMKDSENPWNKFIPKHKAINTLDHGVHISPLLYFQMTSSQQRFLREAASCSDSVSRCG